MYMLMVLLRNIFQLYRRYNWRKFELQSLAYSYIYRTFESQYETLN